MDPGLTTNESPPIYLEENGVDGSVDSGEVPTDGPIPYRGTIMMSMVDGDGFIHHAVVILPVSYEVSSI